MFRYVAGTTITAASAFLLGRAYENNNLVLREAHSTSNLPAQPAMVIPAQPQVAPGQVELSRASQIMKFGYPGFDNLKTYEDFVLSYDRRTKNAHWVCEHLTPERLVYNKDVDRKLCQFSEDSTMHPFFRVTNQDFKGSGYDRGHLAAAGNHRKSQNAVNQTFWLTNMSPQVGVGFNRHKWNDLEKYARNVAKGSINTYIVTGPLFLPHQGEDRNLYVKYKVIGSNHVAVPTHFFKIILNEVKPGEYELESYILPNEVIPDSKPLTDFRVPKEAIEKSAGFLVFHEISKAAIKKVNGAKAGGFW